jgi:MutS-like protein
MKVLLMHPDKDFDIKIAVRDNADDLIQDLELAIIIKTAAGGDNLVGEAFARALLCDCEDAATIFFREEVLADCRAAPDLIRELYALAGEAVEAERHVMRPWSRDEPSAVASSAVQTLELAAGFLERLRAIADEHAPAFQSPGFRGLFLTLADELGNDYLARMHAQLKELHFPFGELISAHLGAGNRGIHYVARRSPDPGLLGRLGLRRAGYGFTIPDRDDAGFEALRELENRGMREIAGVLAHASNHVKAFFTALRTELAFYVGALNLSDALDQASAPLATPTLASSGELDFSSEDLYDVALALALGRAPVPNNLAAEHKPLVLITGANQGGKSTLLRAIGQAQLMAQAGLQAGATRLRLNLSSGVFTHYKREEDSSMESGKLDEELARMSQIAEQITPGALLLCNESFASTNEREGSEIARQIIRAMLDSGIKVVFVTHQYDLAGGFWSNNRDDAVFLRAERDEDGARTYKLAVGRPLPISYGADSYKEVFGRTLRTPDDPAPQKDR